MKLFTALAALTLIAAPVQAEIYSHSFPNVGTTGTYCTTTIIGSYGSTRCSRGLTPSEQKADKAQWMAKYHAGAKKLGLPSNHCEALVKAKGDELFAAGYISEIAVGKTMRWADILVCQGDIAKGKTYSPFPEAEAKRAAGCDPRGHEAGNCYRNGVLDFETSREMLSRSF